MEFMVGSNGQEKSAPELLIRSFDHLNCGERGRLSQDMMPAGPVT